MSVSVSNVKWPPVGLPPSDLILFFDHVVSDDNPLNFAICSQWYPSPFVDPLLSSSALASASSAQSLEVGGLPPGPEAEAAGGTDTDSSEDSDKPTFATCEHYMMYHKARLFDPQLCPAILEAPTPAEAKALGRQVRNFDRTKWAKVSDTIVERGNYLKFSAVDRWEVVKGWAGKVMVECNPDDRIWGVGYGVDDALAHVEEWGSNRMGLALTRALATLLKEKQQAL